MTDDEFNKAFAKHNKSPTSKASRLVLVKGVSLVDAAASEGISPSGVSRLNKKLREIHEKFTKPNRRG